MARTAATKRRRREFQVRSQRERLLDAMANACAEKGYGRTSVADVVAGARVSRATFYELFHDKEDCFLAAYDAILAQFMGRVVAAYQREGPGRCASATGWRRSSPSWPLSPPSRACA